MARNKLVLITYRIANLAFSYADWLQVVILDLKKSRDMLSSLALQGGYSCKFCTAEEIYSWKKISNYEMEKDYVSQSIANKDFFLAVLDNEKLVSYSWYSLEPTAVTGELEFSFPQDCVYMHHTFTLPEYRGRGLNALGIFHAQNFFSQEGYKYIVAIIAKDNFASLRATVKVGYKILGHIFIFTRMNHYFIFHSKKVIHGGMCLKSMRKTIKILFSNFKRIERQKIKKLDKFIKNF